MSILVDIGNGTFVSKETDPKSFADKDLTKSDYNPTPEEIQTRMMVIRHFTYGWTNLYTPRREFNDLSLIDRMSVDQMAFNTYQPNNGEGYAGDLVNAWRSNAIRPVVRNKCILS